MKAGVLERSVKDLLSHRERHPIFTMRAVVLCPRAESGAEQEPAPEALTFLREICEHVRLAIRCS